MKIIIVVSSNYDFHAKKIVCRLMYNLQEFANATFWRETKVEKLLL